MSLKPRDLWLAILAAFLWGATFPVTAIALDQTPPIFFAFLRFACASLFLVFVPRPNVPWKYLIAAGLLFGVGQFGLMFLSMTQGIPAGLASLLIHTQAFFTIILAMIFLSERLVLRQVLAMVLAVIGLAVLITNMADTTLTTPNGLTDNIGKLSGFLLILSAALCAAGGNIVLKKLGGANMLGVVIWMSLAAPAPLLALSMMLESKGSVHDLFATISWSVVAATLYSAAVATVLTFTIWGRLFAAYSLTTIAPFLLLVPIFGIGLSALFLGERLTSIQMLGAGFIFLGLVLTIKSPTNQTKENP